jgi:hypothetical protein
MESWPVACSLDAEALEARRQGLLADLLRRAEHHEALPDGHRFYFAKDDTILETIARTIDAERRCCQFLRFRLTVEPGGGPIDLELTGPAGTREFLAAILTPD